MSRLLVNVDVDDLARGEAFYTAGLGLRVGRRLAGAVELLGLDVPVYLLEEPAGSSATPAGQRRGYGRHWTPVHLDLVVPDVDAAVARALAAGATLEDGPRDEVWGRIATLADPFGHGFCLLSFTDAGYDALRRS